MATPTMPVSQRIHTDVIEYLTEKIIFQKENRLENWEALEVSFRDEIIRSRQKAGKLTTFFVSALLEFNGRG